MYKIVLIGDSGVGKSHYCCKLLDREYNPTSTIGVDYIKKVINIDDKIIKLSIWDCAGQERFRSIVSIYYRGADVIIIMYENGKEDTIQYWYDEIKKHIPDAMIVLIKNKIDKIEKNENIDIESLSKQFNINLFFEISSLTGEGVNESLEKIAIELNKKTPRKIKGVNLKNDNNTNKKCCSN